jgi:hypothetical protein
MIELVAGEVEGFYWTNGQNDVWTIIDATEEVALAWHWR